MMPSPRFWLKSERGLLVQVSTVGYEDDNIVNFLKIIIASEIHRTQLQLPEELPEGADPLTLHITETADALCDHLPLAHILTQLENSAKKPLVVVMKVEDQWKRQCLDSSFQGRSISEEQSSSFVLSDLFLKDSGLKMNTHSLFCCSQFWKQFEFLDMILHTPRPDSLSNENPNFSGWILGSPGTGKSKTTLAFLSTIDRVYWAITWIASGHDSCYQIVDNNKQILRRRRLKSEHIKRIIREEPNVNWHHIMVVDSIRNDEPHWQVKWICMDWLRENYEERRLVFVSSTASRGKVYLDEDSKAGAKEFLVDSWNWDNYIHVVKNDDFYNDIQGMLDSSGCEALTSREDLLKSKYFFAGGCPSLMFDHDTTTVREFLRIAVTTVANSMLFVEDIQGERSESTPNRLLTGFYDVKRGMRVTSIVSKYAATLVAQFKGPKSIKGFVNELSMYLNPSMRGWLVEMRFFASLPQEDFTFTVDGEETTWPKSTFIDFDPRNVSEIPHDAVWLKPIKRNEGGYDAVYVERKNNLVRFVQVTTSKRHSLKLECFHAFMEKLKVHMETETLEIYFLFQDKGGPSQICKPKGVSGMGSLKQFFFGWEQGKEWRNVRQGLFKCPIPYE